MVDGYAKECDMSRKVAAIILARGGSKGIPKKNILKFCGHPLVAWTVMQCLNSKLINDIYISSDSDEILEIASSYGAKIIKRPDEFAQDHSKSEDAMIHALKSLDYTPDIVLMLEPTAPLRRPDDFDNAIMQFITEGWDSGFSGALLQDFLIWKKNKDDILESVNYDYKNQGPRQEREPDYVENGAIFIFKPSVMLKNKNRFGGKIGIYLNEFWQSFEIDEPSDWRFVELIFKTYLLEDYKKLGVKVC